MEIGFPQGVYQEIHQTTCVISDVLKDEHIKDIDMNLATRRKGIPQREKEHKQNSAELHRRYIYETDAKF